VRPSATEYKRAFLEKKGLTAAEISEAFRRVPEPPPGAPAEHAPPPSQQQLMYAPPPPPPPPPPSLSWSQARALLRSGALTGGAPCQQRVARVRAPPRLRR
jgi:hypothetical protein